MAAYRRLSLMEREELSRQLATGTSLRVIAQVLQRAPSAVKAGERALGLLIATFPLLVAAAPPVFGEVGVEGRAIVFYTDDVGIFSATRRLTLDGDPTQPALDTNLTNQGSDVVFEPDVGVSVPLDSRLGRAELSLRGQGFIYVENPRFNHGTLRVQAVQAFSADTSLRLRYYYAPDQFLGENEVNPPGVDRLADEVLTSHIWSARVERDLMPDLEVRLLARYGLRRYDEPFTERDTDFWTVGPHVKWRFSHRITLELGYHYERGLADGRKQPELEDDVSYVNHYTSADLDVELTERLSLMAALHYERNNWTSGIVGDERNGAHEDVVQGEVILVHRLAEAWRVFVGFQRSSRKQSFEPESVKNTNIGLGVDTAF